MLIEKMLQDILSGKYDGTLYLTKEGKKFLENLKKEKSLANS